VQLEPVLLQGQELLDQYLVPLLPAECRFPKHIFQPELTSPRQQEMR
jgi:hypothetical protein